MSEHQVPHPDLAGYLFGILDPGETQAFRAHLAGSHPGSRPVTTTAPPP
jgi:Putative zinc-finger